MEPLGINPRKLNLLKRSNNLLEKTKKDYKKYEKERKTLLELTRNESVDYDEWENILTSIEILVSHDENKTKNE